MTQRKHPNIQKLVLSAMFLTIGIILPFFTAQIKQIGNMLLPMHIPVLLCGFICGWKHGLTIGFLLPLTRSILFSMPALYPSAIAMAFELATYGTVTGIIYHRFHIKNTLTTYASLITAMIAGRIVWGCAMIVLLGINGNSLTAKVFFTSAVLNALPGILIQLILIPGIIMLLERSKALH